MKLFDDRKLYKIAEAARLWGVSRGTMYNMMRRHPFIVKRLRKRDRTLLIGERLNLLYYN